MSELYVEVSGQGPDLVLLHGWGLNLRVWDGLVAELSQGFRVIALDLPGHGRSPWDEDASSPAAQAWCIRDALVPLSNRYALLGWSLGGQIALDLAAAMPAQIERLVLVATSPRFASGPDWPYGMAPSVLGRMAAQLRTDYRRTVSDFLELQVRGSTKSELVLEELRAALFQHGEAHPDALVAGLGTLTKNDLRPNLRLIRAPALVIAGQYDRVSVPWASRTLADSLPQGQFVEFRRAAHAPFLSHPAEFAARVREFLTTEIPDGDVGAEADTPGGHLLGG